MVKERAQWNEATYRPSTWNYASDVHWYPDNSSCISAVHWVS